MAAGLNGSDLITVMDRAAAAELLAAKAGSLTCRARLHRSGRRFTKSADSAPFRMGVPRAVASRTPNSLADLRYVVVGARRRLPFAFLLWMSGGRADHEGMPLFDAVTLVLLVLSALLIVNVIVISFVLDVLAGRDPISSRRLARGPR